MSRFSLWPASMSAGVAKVIDRSLRSSGCPKENPTATCNKIAVGAVPPTRSSPEQETDAGAQRGPRCLLLFATARIWLFAGLREMKVDHQRACV